MTQRSTGVDFGGIAEDYARYRGGFPELFFEQLEKHYGAPLAGARVLDVGCGTGELANDLARRGCEVVGIDPSESLLSQAKQVAEREGLDVTYLSGSAEETGLDPGFDLVTAGRCWHWFSRRQASLEMRRILRRGGMLVICHFDRVCAAPGDLFSATRALVERANPKWADSPPQIFGHGAGLYPEWLSDITNAGFHNIESFSFDIDVPYTHDAWRGRVRSSGGVGGSLTSEQVARLDAEVGKLLRTHFREEPVLVTHRLFCAIGRTPP